jgi:hypothetical protein
MRQQARRGAVGTCRRRLNPMTTERSPPSETGDELLPGPPAGRRTFTATTCAAGQYDGGFESYPTDAAGRRPLPTSQASPGRVSPCGRPDAYAARPRHRRPRRPCHYRAIHNGRERLQADTHGQSHGRHHLRRSWSGQVATPPDLALQARSRGFESHHLHKVSTRTRDRPPAYQPRVCRSATRAGRQSTLVVPRDA